MAQRGREIRVRVEAVLLSLVDGKLAVAARGRRKSDAGRGRDWALPGGRIRPETDEHFQGAIDRILRKRFGWVEPPPLEQLSAEGDSTRGPKGWSVSVVYCGLVPEAMRVAGPRQSVHWLPVDTDPGWTAAQASLVRRSIERVRSWADFSARPLALLPEQFTLSQMQGVYQQLLGEELDKRGFRRRIEDLALLEPVPGEFVGGVQRPAQVYRMRRPGQPTADCT